MRGVRRLIVVAVLGAATLAPPAIAAEVARIEGARLTATDGRDGFCLRLARTGALGSGGASSCGRPPWRPHRSTLLSVIDDDRVLVAGAVPAAVARAEAELADGRRVGTETLAGSAYRGRAAGRLRFFLASVPVTDTRDDEAGGLVVVRFLDAAGTLVGAEEGARGRTVRGPVRLLRVGRRGASIAVVAELQRRLAPTPLALDRFETVPCLLVNTRQGFSGGTSTGCREAGPRRPALALSVENGCGRLPSVLAGFVGDDVSAVRLRFGSGATRQVRTRTLQGALGTGDRYVAVALPRGEALRSAAAVGADATLAIGAPPGGLPCVRRDSGVVGVYSPAEPEGPALPPAPDQQIAVEAEGHRLVVRDAEADRLCAGIDRLRADGGDCLLPQVTADLAFAVARAGVVAAVLPAEVARVRLPGGREVPTVAGEGYTGRYAGHVRFLLASAPAAERLTMLDAAGAVIGRLVVLSKQRPDAGPVVLARGRGWRLTASRLGDSGCVGIGIDGCLAPLGTGDGAYAAVRCSPRVAVLFGTLGARTRSVTVTLRGGRRLRPRIVRVPRRVGGGRAFVLALPRGAEVTALRLGRRSTPFPLLPAARQCGYGVAEPFLSPPPYR